MVRYEEASYRPGCQCDDDASEKGEVVSWISSMPHCREQEGGSCRVVRTALVTHPAQAIQELHAIHFRYTITRNHEKKL